MSRLITIRPRSVVASVHPDLPALLAALDQMPEGQAARIWDAVWNGSGVTDEMIRHAVAVCETGSRPRLEEIR